MEAGLKTIVASSKLYSENNKLSISFTRWISLDYAECSLITVSLLMAVTLASSATEGFGIYASNLKEVWGVAVCSNANIPTFGINPLNLSYFLALKINKHLVCFWSDLTAPLLVIRVLWKDTETGQLTHVLAFDTFYIVSDPCTLTSKQHECL